MRKLIFCLISVAVAYLTACSAETLIPLVAGILSGLLPAACALLRNHRRLLRHLEVCRRHRSWLRSRCRNRSALSFNPARSDAPLAVRTAADESALLAAVEMQLHAWDRLFDCAYHTCNAKRFLGEFERYTRSLKEDDSLFVMIRYAADVRYGGLAGRLRRLHPALTDYETDLLCMLRLGFAFNSIRLLHGHDNVCSLYSRRTKIHRKLHLPRRYPIEKYLLELSGEEETTIRPECPVR